MKKNNTFRRAAALVAALSITVSLAAPAFAGTYYIDDGDITIIKNENGSQTIKQQGKEDCTDQVGDETIITTHKKAITTLESDLEGPAAEDSGFGPVVEDNYQPAPPAQPEDAEEPKDADQPEDDDQKNAEESENDEEQKDADRQENTDRKESAEEPEDADRKESAGQQAQLQQAAPAAAPAASTPGNGFCKNIITVINNFADTVLNLTLRDVKIDVSNTGWENHAGKAALNVQGEGNVEIELDGKNELKSGYYRAGLEKNNSTSAGTLTLKDDKEAGNGSLNAEGGELSAGIGACYEQGTKNIIITGSTVTATGGDGGAGIGGGKGGAAENIIITGSTVTATGGGSVLDWGGAGIGGGSDGRNSDSNGKNITITGSTVTAKGGNGSAGIGGGVGGSGESITITGSTVTAEGGNGAAGIGSGNGKNITITDSTVTATGKYGGAGIGGGNGKNGEAITITGSTVTATGKYGGAGIGGGGFDGGGNGNHITITGSTVIATSEGVGERGNRGGAGIGGGCIGNGENIAITGSTVTATGHFGGAGIGGGYKGSGSNVTVSGAAQVTAIAFAGDRWDGVGATIGSGSGGSTKNPDGTFTPGSGTEIRADISGLTTGYIHHIIYEQDGTTIKKEWWEPERPQPKPENPQPNPEDPNAPAEESNEVDLGTPGLHVETLEGVLLPFNAQQQGSTLRVTSDTLAARLHGTRQALEALREQGVEQIQFVTTLKTTTLPVAELLAEGGSWFALEHNGLVSRQLSAAQAESLKCRMR